MEEGGGGKYTVVTDPRFPRPETNAEAAATPTSPWRRWKISLGFLLVYVEGVNVGKGGRGVPCPGHADWHCRA